MSPELRQAVRAYLTQGSDDTLQDAIILIQRSSTLTYDEARTRLVTLFRRRIDSLVLLSIRGVKAAVASMKGVTQDGNSG